VRGKVTEVQESCVTSWEVFTLPTVDLPQPVELGRNEGTNSRREWELNGIRAVKC